MATAIVVVSVVVSLALIAWFFLGKRNPARGEGGQIRRLDSESDRFYDRVDRPAGPDAESMGAETMLGDHVDTAPPPKP